MENLVGVCPINRIEPDKNNSTATTDCSRVTVGSERYNRQNVTLRSQLLKYGAPAVSMVLTGESGICGFWIMLPELASAKMIAPAFVRARK